jgi:SAM-dependent methyltransferase
MSLAAAAYRRFWVRVGERFPDLGGAASTRYYAANEERLLAEHLPPLAGLRILKTDLWDEAKNTRILAWAAARGAHTFGVDISEPIVIQAMAAFTSGSGPLRAAAGDVRALPFRDASFDAIYSMGTIEHFDETEQAVREMVRVLKPGGRAIVGVPNRRDPFLRPLLATLLQAAGLYAYGYEKSYSRRALRDMLERAGFVVTNETAILFIPGGLRMLDLACHAWCRPLSIVTAAMVWPFVWLDRHVAAVRRHGYLLATVVTKMGSDSESSPPRV